MPPFRQPASQNDEWEAPDYFKPETSESSSEWTAPDYFKPEKEAEKKPSEFKRRASKAAELFVRDVKSIPHSLNEGVKGVVSRALDTPIVGRILKSQDPGSESFLPSAENINKTFKTNKGPDYGYGPRWDEKTQKYSGPPKGLGYLGPLKTKSGDTMGEYSIDGEINGKPTQYPSIVPTLSKDEVQHLLNMGENDKIPDSIRQKAEAHAKSRIDAGKDPFAQTGEQRLDLHPDLERNPTPKRIDKSSEPETYWGGFAKGLYNEWARPLASATGLAGLLSGGEGESEVKAPERLTAVRSPRPLDYVNKSTSEVVSKEPPIKQAPEVVKPVETAIKQPIEEVKKEMVNPFEKKPTGAVNLRQDTWDPKTHRWNPDTKSVEETGWKYPEKRTSEEELTKGFGGSGHPESADYTSKVLSDAGKGEAGLSIEDKEGFKHVVYRNKKGEPVAVAKIVAGPDGKNLIQDLAADKSKGLLTGRATKAIGDKLVELKATESSGTISSDAQNFLDGMKSRMAAAADIKPVEVAEAIPKPDESLPSQRQPIAKFRYDWPEAGGKQYDVIDPDGLTGGFHRSTVSEPRLKSLGIEIPESSGSQAERDIAHRDETAAEGPTKYRKSISEWKAPDYFKPVNAEEEAAKAPQAMRVPIKGQKEPNIAMGPKMENTRMLDILGNQLYTRPSPQVVAKELLVNSLDEHRIAGVTKPIHIVFDKQAKIPRTGEDGNAIIVKDYGRGLSKNQMYTVLTDVGSTGKGTEEGAAGGFGIAKAAPFLSGKHAEVENIVKEGKDIVKYSFDGTPTDFKNQQVGMKVKREVLPSGTQTGLKMKTYFGKDTSLYGADDLVKNIGENSPSSTSPIHFAQNYSSDEAAENYIKDPENAHKATSEAGNTDYDVQYMANNKKEFKPSTPKPLQDTISTPGADIHIHYEDKPTDTAQKYNLHILNKGTYQETQDGYYGSNIDNVPSNITANVVAKVEEGTPGYPFGANREKLDQKVSYAIDKWVNDNIVSGAQVKQAQKLKGLYSGMETIPGGAGNIRKGTMFDAGNRLTLPEKMGFQFSNIVKDVTNHFDGVLNDIVTAMDKNHGNTSLGDKLEKTGLLMSEDKDSVTYGIHIPNPTDATKSTILINWPAHMSRKPPLEAAWDATITALHEGAHINPAASGGFARKSVSMTAENAARISDFWKSYNQQLDEQGGLNAGHGVAFLKSLGEVFETYGADKTFEAADKLHGLITDSAGEYNAATKKILQVYKDSRGRSETSEDFLSSTGVKQESKTGRTNSIINNDKSDGEGTTWQAVSKLFSALNDAKGREGEQASIYKTERARRFAAFGGVKEEGAFGAAKSLSKLRGDFDKVNPGESLNLSNKDTDSLFTAVKKANITEGEKARGYTSLFALLNGDRIPQRNELAILDEVFGNGFAGKITEMHGGIGAVGIKLSKLANTMKSMQNSISLAAPLRHGIGLVARKEFGPAFADMFKFFAKPEYYKNAMDALEKRPTYMLSREAGLFTAKPGSLMNSEEEFLNSYVGAIPGIKQMVGASQRAYTGFLNKLRSDTFDSMLKQAKSLGVDISTNVGDQVVPSKETKAIARYINNATGRGDLPGGLNKITNELNLLLWSPRMISSRINMLANPKIYTDLPKGMRLEGLKSLFGIAALGTAIDTLGAYGGAKISTNILSTDFGKSRFGKDVIDPWGGFQQYIVGAARFLAGKTDSSQPTSRLEIAGRFLANKESPAASLAHTLLTAKKFTGKSNDSTAGNFTTQYGEKTNIQSEIGKRFIPIFIQDIEELMKSNPDWSENVGLTAVMTGASLAGMSQSYKEKKGSKLGLGSMRLR